MKPGKVFQKKRLKLQGSYWCMSFLFTLGVHFYPIILKLHTNRSSKLRFEESTLIFLPLTSWRSSGALINDERRWNSGHRCSPFSTTFHTVREVIDVSPTAATASHHQHPFVLLGINLVTLNNSPLEEAFTARGLSLGVWLLALDGNWNI